MADLLGIVPARGGSKGIVGKNLQLLDGKPLFLHAADTLNQFCTRVVVASDDDTIASLARVWGFEVHRREGVTDYEPVIEVARQVATDWTAGVVLLQPTVPPTFNIAKWVETMRGQISNGGVVAGTSAGHILWGSTFDVIGERANRQQLSDWPVQEIGLYYWASGSSGQAPVGIAPIDRDETLFDIDTPADLTAARQHFNRKTILLRYVADDERGTGHVRRMLTLAEALQHHRIVWQCADMKTADFEVATEIVARGWTIPYPPGPETDWYEPDLIITDTLDNAEAPGGRWVTFEDRGAAAHTADLTINALYPGPVERYNDTSRHGPDWVILRPEFAYLPPFEITNEGRVLVVFGGTDPAKLSNKTQNALHHASGVDRDWTYIMPGVAAPLAELMHGHDLLITSAGRTVYEAAAVGIPSIVMAQNNREATHVHLGPTHGNIYMGLGRLVTVDGLRHTVEQTLADEALRRELSQTARASIDGKGLDRIVAEIERILEGR